MIRPELAAMLRRWTEPLLAAGATLAALWIVGASNLRWGWVSVVLAAIVLAGGVLWIREAIRRVRFASAHGQGAGSVFVEERRLLYVGGLGNVQLDLGEVDRVDLALSKPNGRTWVSLLLHSPGAPPASVPLNAEGSDGLIDALCALPGLSFDRLQAAIDSQKEKGARSPVTTIWRRGDG